ncbi:MAG: sugar transferase [Ignavibacteriaceae bacterium]|jgi:exopolysaccharide biosynthesis polyprenyl glycosylphosphotransferase
MKKIPLYKYIFGVTDIFVLFASFFTAMYLLRRNPAMGFIEFTNAAQNLILIFFLVSIFFVAIFNFNGLYRLNIILTRALHLTHIMKALYYGALTIVLVSIMIESSSVIDSRLLIFLFSLIALPSLYFVRTELMRRLYLLFSTTGFRRNIIILGDGKSGKLLAAKLLFENPIGLEVVGFVDDDKGIGEVIVSDAKVIGRFNEIEELIKKFHVDEIIIALDSENYDKFLDVIDLCKKLDVNIRITSELFDVVAQKVSTEKYSDIPVIDVSTHYNNGITLALKRFTDIVISTFALIILSPVILFIIIAIKFSSSGKILFNQVRIGKNGKEFKFYKFRSMRENTEGDKEEERVKKMIEFMQDDEAESGTKIINNSRITWIGKIIRKASLDELPQLLNVLKGDMSIVGPRPCLPYEYQNYDEWQKRRVNVIPGCTGVWQVWGRSSVSFKESVVLDLYYINNMSPWFDLQIMVQTVPAILTARGAE